MKLLIITLFPVFAFTQTIPPDTCFTEQQVHDISETLDDLYYQDSINQQIISQQKQIIAKQDEVMRLDSLQLRYNEQQIKLLETNIDLYVKKQKRLEPKWYDNKIIWFSAGILTTVLTGKLIVEVVQ